MTVQPPDQSNRPRTGVPPPEPHDGKPQEGALSPSFLVVAVLVPIIAGGAVLGAEVWRLNDRVDQLATKVNGIGATLGARSEETNAKLDATNTKLDAISQRLPAGSKRSEPKSRRRPALSPKASPPFAA